MPPESPGWIHCWSEVYGYRGCQFALGALELGLCQCASPELIVQLVKPLPMDRKLSGLGMGIDWPALTQ
jgi:hypothetical protein